MTLTTSIPAKPAALLRRVAPGDTAGQSIYILPADLVESRFPETASSGDIFGWTCPAMDLHLQPLLTELGHWRGRGFCTAIRVTSFQVLLHEFAHWLDGSWEGHGLRFIRACGHLAWRARQHGHQYNLRDLGATGEGYGLSHASHYSQALGNEPRAMADLPIRQILDSPPPTAFAQLWANDTRKQKQ
jgi:hypothetical protein